MDGCGIHVEALLLVFRLRSAAQPSVVHLELTQTRQDGQTNEAKQTKAVKLGERRLQLVPSQPDNHIAKNSNKTVLNNGKLGPTMGPV